MVGRRVDLLAGGAVALVTVALFAPVVAFVIQEDDYKSHADLVRQLISGGPLSAFLAKAPHFLYHLLVVAAYRAWPGATLTDAAFAVTLASYLAAAVSIYALFGALAGRALTVRTGLLYAALSIALMLVMPINLFTPHNRYLGYIVAHTYHNPTVVLLKPLALGLFYLAVRSFDPRPLPLAGRYAGTTAAATAACLLAKPNYVIALVPALLLAAGQALRRGARVHLRPLVGGVLLPAAAILGAQAAFSRGESQIVYAPLGVIYEWAWRINPAAGQHLLAKLVLSILFPLAVWLVLRARAQPCLYLKLAWLTFAFGAAYTYLLAEAGGRMNAGNFTWSGQIAVFVLFVASAVFLAGELRAARVRSLGTTAGLALVGAIFALHLLCGLQWYGLHTGWLPMGYIIAVW